MLAQSHLHCDDALITWRHKQFLVLCHNGSAQILYCGYPLQTLQEDCTVNGPRPQASARPQGQSPAHRGDVPPPLSPMTPLGLTDRGA
jgi:hypothetical protein